MRNSFHLPFHEMCASGDTPFLSGVEIITIHWKVIEAVTYISPSAVTSSSTWIHGRAS